MADVRSFGRDYDSLEGTHPTNLGMRQFASMVVRAMQLADAAEADAPEASSASASVAEADADEEAPAGAGANAEAATSPNPARTQAEGDTHDNIEDITAGAQPETANPALDLQDFCGAPESAQLCDEPTCIGCPHAANTGNQWLCRCLK